MNSSIDPWYYSEENSGYWLKCPDYELISRNINECKIT